MGLKISLDRPVAGLVARARPSDSPHLRPATARRYAPPNRTSAEATSFEPVVDESHRIATAVAVARIMLSGVRTESELANELGATVRSDVVAWSPAMYATSRAELIRQLLGTDDTLTDAIIAFDAIDAVGCQVYLEWRVSGHFSAPCFVDDDLLVEPCGRPIVSAGVLLVTFCDDLVAEIRCYYDEFALVEQILRTS